MKRMIVPECENCPKMHKLKIVWIFEGMSSEMNCAIPEILEIIEGYGGITIDIVKEFKETKK